MVKIEKIKAREILDSRGNPTLEVTVWVKKKRFLAGVPAGASKGTHEALELRDGNQRYGGKGVLKAIRNVEKELNPLLKGKDCRKQREIDELMIKQDGTENKERLGANALLGVSLAVCRAGAFCQRKELFEYINSLLKQKRKISLPRPLFNLINGGKHAGNDLAFQEFLISPRKKSFKENLRIGSEIYYSLKEILKKKYGLLAINIGDEGGFAPPLRKAEEALDLLTLAIKKAGYEHKVSLALDCAASNFYFPKKGKEYYQLHKLFTKKTLKKYYLTLIRKYSLFSLEDPFEEEDFEGFKELREESRIQIVGDDLTVTNKERIEGAIREKSCTCLLLKVNQIGTLSEALDAAELAFKAGWKVMVSHRSGETNDDFIADLAVGLGCGLIKAGAPCRGERLAKYNRLLKIEELIKSRN